MEKYDAILKGEKKDIADYDVKLQEITFDYFNLIVREYYMAVDKWGQNEEYTSEIKVQFDKIDAELDEEEKLVPVPEDLTKQVADEQLQQKEKVLT